MSTLHTRIIKGSRVLHYQSVHFSGHVETWVSNHFCWSPKILLDVDIFAATSWPTLQCGFPESIRVDCRPRERYGESAGCPAFGQESGAWGKGPGRWGTSEELYAGINRRWHPSDLVEPLTLYVSIRHTKASLCFTCLLVYDRSYITVQVSFAVCDIQSPGALRDLLRPKDLVVGLHPCGSLGEESMDTLKVWALGSGESLEVLRLWTRMCV